MHDWSHGYNVSSGYTYGFYPEMAPGWLDLCAMVQGFLPPEPDADGRFRYLDLGCGQGFGLALMAAANPNGQFVGVDFNPEHIDHARRLARAAGLENVEFIEGDFTALAAAWPDTLGRFHYVALHGIYSWIPHAVQQAIVDCLDHATHPGALVYLSYNATPGWLSTVPFQHLARRLEQTEGRSPQAALTDAVGLFQAMDAAGSPLFGALPTLKKRVENIPSLNSAYAVQEYLHDHWQPLWFSQTASALSRAKLSFVGSATLVEALMPALLPPAMRDLVDAQRDPLLRQDVMDCLLVQGFRRDIFCRGPRRHFGPGAGPMFDQQVRLVREPADPAQIVITTSAGAVTLPAESVTQFIAALRNGPQSLATLATLPGLSAGTVSSHLQTLVLLIHAGLLQRVVEPPAPAVSAQRFNAAVAAAVGAGAPYGHLAAAVTGTGLGASDVDLLLLDALLTGRGDTPAALASALDQALVRLGRGLLHQGQALAGDAYRERLAALANSFVHDVTPRWRALGVIG